jgi:hypothetical protein
MQVSTIAKQLFFTTFRIDIIAANGGQGSGTDFLFMYKSGDHECPFVVTKKHGVDGMKPDAIKFQGMPVSEH